MSSTRVSAGLYLDLLLGLRADAAAICGALLELKGEPGPLLPGEIHVSFVENSERVGRWFARLTRPGWVGGYSGEGCPSEVEAVCSLIERGQRDLEAGGRDSPLHLLERLKADAAALGAYRTLAVQSIRGGVQLLADVIDALDALSRPTAPLGAAPEQPAAAPSSEALLERARIVEFIRISFPAGWGGGLADEIERGDHWKEPSCSAQ